MKDVREAVKQVRERYLSTQEGRGMLLWAMQASIGEMMDSDAVGRWPASRLETLVSLRETSHALLNTTWTHPAGKQVSWSPAEWLELTSRFCAKCGLKTGSGDHHDPDVCVVAQVVDT